MHVSCGRPARVGRAFTDRSYLRARARPYARDRAARDRQLAAEIGRRKRRGPALPGLTYSTPSRSSTDGRCECPETTTRDAGGAWLDVDLREIVDRVDHDLAERDELALPQLPAHAPRSLLPRTAVTGATARERLEDRRVADVAAVNDVVAAAQEVEHFRPQQAVGVRDQADAHSPLARRRARRDLHGGAAARQPLVLTTHRRARAASA